MREGLIHRLVEQLPNLEYACSFAAVYEELQSRKENESDWDGGRALPRQHGQIPRHALGLCTLRCEVCDAYTYRSMDAVAATLKDRLSFRWPYGRSNRTELLSGEAKAILTSLVLLERRRRNASQSMTNCDGRMLTATRNQVSSNHSKTHSVVLRKKNILNAFPKRS
jgi:hypothetical protein